MKKLHAVGVELYNSKDKTVSKCEKCRWKQSLECQELAKKCVEIAQDQEDLIMEQHRALTTKVQVQEAVFDMTEVAAIMVV